MPGNVRIHLIFVNHDGKPIEVEVSDVLTTREFKQVILESHWPTNYIPVEEVERLRLICGGRELEDGSKVAAVRDFIKSSEHASIHVTVKRRLSHADPATSKSGSKKGLMSRCACGLM